MTDMKITTYDGWNDRLATLQNPPLLQTAEWAKVKGKYGWQPIPVEWLNDVGETIAMASVLKKQVKIKGARLPLSILYVPKGPVLDWNNKQLAEQVLADIKKIAKKEKAIFIKIDPDIITDTFSNQEISVEEISPQIGDSHFSFGEEWQFSHDQIQFRNTITIDLTKDEETLLAEMKQKTRYNIRLAGRKGVSVREGNEEDFAMLYRMYAQTSLRDGFIIRSEKYYLDVWRSFFNQRMLTPLIAEYEGQPLAGLMLFHFDRTAYYVYGMSTNEHRNLMPTYLLQWAAMQKAKRLGCKIYDLWGAPNNIDESDPMWGVYRFKIGLGGQTVCTIGAHDFVAKPFWHYVYAKAMPSFLDLLRKRGKRLTETAVSQSL
jgi:lipid II:glycine glycyltransferase (peptidoglycan interpeptide bridge formation enzyme)